MSITNKHFKESKWLENVSYFFDVVAMGLPPGPRCMPFKWPIDFFKFGMPVFCIMCMTYFENFSLACWVYTALHGTYGIFWRVKSIMTPDPWLEQPLTIVSCINSIIFVLAPYATMIVWLAAGGYVSVYAYVYMYVLLYMCRCTCMCMCMCICMCMCLCWCTCVCVGVHVDVHVCRYTCMCMCMCMYMEFTTTLHNIACYTALEWTATAIYFTK